MPYKGGPEVLLAEIVHARGWRVDVSGFWNKRTAMEWFDSQEFGETRPGIELKHNRICLNIPVDSEAAAIELRNRVNNAGDSEQGQEEQVSAVVTKSPGRIKAKPVKRVAKSK